MRTKEEIEKCLKGNIEDFESAIEEGEGFYSYKDLKNKWEIVQLLKEILEIQDSDYFFNKKNSKK
jgi:hypothetical protein